MDRERDLRSKLKRSFGVAQREPQPGTRTDLRERLARHARVLGERSARHATPLEALVPGGVEARNDAGSFWLCRAALPLSFVHGAHALARVRDVDFARLGSLATNTDLADASLERCLFLDTETTGLSGGAGTAVFLCGLAFVLGDELVVEQVFLRAFADERAALLHVAQRLRERPLQVTFVGKTFDRHRLAARMTLHKIAHAMLDPRHLDLFHLARRAWKKELPDTKLRTVEEHRLGVFRADDLPGSEAPRAWLDWLRDGSGPIERVFEHNRLDVLSLVALMAELGVAHPRRESG
ncbi:MAG: ribonuclease H-like domain-containing protein [Planctomycetes bacterium]|nr:ribonuclease H-like domain-containing protein [Planctomycetota bacterium]